MGKKPPPTRNPEDEPIVIAEKIRGKFASKTAYIATSGTIIAALLGGGGLWIWLSKPPIEKKGLAGRVIDKTTKQNIGGADVRLESPGMPQFKTSTDSDGNFSFSLSEASKQVRMRVNAAGYDEYNRIIVPAQNNEFLEIQLEQSKNIPPPSSPSPTASPPPKRPLSVRSEGGVSTYIASCRSLYYQRRYEAAIVQCDQALKIQPSNREAVTLRTQIKKTIEILNGRER